MPPKLYTNMLDEYTQNITSRLPGSLREIVKEAHSKYLSSLISPSTNFLLASHSLM